MLENISQPTWLCCVLLETVTAITTDLAEATLGFAVTQSSYAYCTLLTLSIACMYAAVYFERKVAKVDWPLSCVMRAFNEAI